MLLKVTQNNKNLIANSMWFHYTYTISNFFEDIWD